jgi:hypothetical protein
MKINCQNLFENLVGTVEALTSQHSERFSYKRVEKIFFGSELYFLGSNYYFFMILRDPSQFLGKILTGQNIGKSSLYDTDVSSLWKNVEKKVYNYDQWSSPVVCVVFGHSPPTQLTSFPIPLLLLYPRTSIVL